MGRPRKLLTLEDEEKMVSLLRQGVSVNSTARTLGHGRSVVTRVAGKYGVPISRHDAQQNSGGEIVEYNKERRIKLLNKILNKFEELCEKVDKPGSAYQYALGVGIIIDKYRQEELLSQPGSHGAVVDLLSRMAERDRQREESDAEQAKGIKIKA